MAIPPYTIFVNSTDSFEDTWGPFFRLLTEYWPQVDHVVLNTETKEFSYPGLRIDATKTARPGEGRIPWGECMIRALVAIPTEYFVYLQDDYFLFDAVKAGVVDQAVGLMEAESLDCLRLMECGGAGPYEPTDHPWLVSVARDARYRISLQAGVWSKQGMMKYLRAHESPWQMEVWGSKRAARTDGRIWAVSRHVYGDDHSQIIPYVPTGIVKGKWSRDAVEELFRTHGIDVDFEQRGWWDSESAVHKDVRWILSKLPKAPRYVWNRMRSL